MKKIVLLLLFFSAAAMAKTKIESYDYPSEIENSKKYSVTANGIEITTFETPEPDLAIFGSDGVVDVQIVCNGFTPDSVVVRPLAKNYVYSLEGNVIKLRLTTGDRVSVEPDYSEQKPLFIFVNPLEAEAVKEAKKDYRTIFYKAGYVHEVGEIVPESGSRIYIQGGAVVKGFVNRRDVSRKITLEGCGILDASDADRNAVRIHECRGLTIRNMTTVSKNRWINLLYNCSDTEIDNYHIIGTRTTTNKNGNENDGLDLVGCHDVNVRHCFSYTHDDAYCIKTGAFNLNAEAYNIRHEDLVGWNITSGNTCEIGYACGQDVYNIWYKDIYSIHSGGRLDRFRRSTISIHQGRGADVHDIHYENVYSEDPFEHILSIHAFRSPYKSDQQAWHPGHIYNVTIENLKAWKPAPCGSVITGAVAEVPVENVVIKDFYIAGKKVTDFESGDVRNHKFCKNIKFE